MNSLALIVLAIYSLANAGIIYYFFIYRQREIDKEYKCRIERIETRE